MRMTLVLLLGLLALPVSAEIYRYTDAKGNTVFTNQPPTNVDSEEVKLPPANTVQSPPADAYPTTSGASQDSEPQAAYQRLELTGLPDEEAIRANNGSFRVNVAIEPALAPGHQLRLLLDDQPYGQAGTSNSFQLVNIDRGTHALAVEVLSGSTSIQRSSPVTITVQRVQAPKPAAPKPKPTPGAP